MTAAKKLYLASPYTSPYPEVRNARVKLASAIAARLMERGYVVFSPITHGHSIAEHLPAESAHSHAFWMAQCLPMLADCDLLVVLPVDGWRESRGVAEELAFARLHDIPIFIWQSHDSMFELLDDEELVTCNYKVITNLEKDLPQ